MGKALSSSEIDTMNPEDIAPALKAQGDRINAENVAKFEKEADKAGIPRTTIRVGGGKEHEMGPNGEVSAECKADLARAIGSTLGKLTARKSRPGGIAVEQLKSIVARVERLEAEKSGLAADIRDVYAEAKGNGFDVKAIRTIIKMRRMDASEREEAETVLDTYLRALGMQPDLFDESE